jgi:hypothetical protein
MEVDMKKKKDNKADKEYINKRQNVRQTKALQEINGLENRLLLDKKWNAWMVKSE